MNAETIKHRIRVLEKEIEALLIAIVREVASHEFYSDLIIKHKDNRVGKIFEELAEHETDHRNHLEEKLANLQDELEELKKQH